MTYTITIPDVPPSLNDCGRAWGKAYRLKKQWANDIFVVMGRLRGVELIKMAEAKTRMCVCITVHHPREYDDDNKRFAEKIIYDALQQLGFLYKDSPEFVKRTLRWFKCKRKDKKTVIEIGPAGAGGGE